MAFCKNCGEQLQENEKFCGSCGEPVAQAEEQPFRRRTAQPDYQQYQQTFQEGINRVSRFAQETADETSGIDPTDIEKNKAIGGLAYFIFFLPLLVCPDSKYGRFHANQGLMYLLLCIGSGIINSILSSLFWRIWLITSLVSIVLGIIVLVIGVIGLINGFSGRAKELPLIGGVRLIR